MNLLHKVLPSNREAVEKSKQATEDKLLHELASAQIETRFRASLASGRSTGDIVTVDEYGNQVKETQNTNIFDL